MLTNTPSLFLRRVLLIDALVSGATGILLFAAAPLLESLLQLPEMLLRPAGLFLIPYGALVAYIATRVNPPRWAAWAVVLVNALWAIDSFLLLVSGWVNPNTLGVAFVIAQAVVVAAFAIMQAIGLRQQVRATA